MSIAARRLVVVATLAVSATAASAHDTWLLPASLRVPAGRPVALSLTSGMAFPADDFAIRPERVRRATVRLGGRSTPLAAPRSQRQALRYRWTPASAGVATLAVELAPRTLELEPDKIEEYFAEIVPEADPTALRAGDVLPVRVLRAGAPAAGFVVGARHEADAHPAFVRTGVDGRARVPLPRAGRWLLNGTDLRHVAERDLTWRSDFATVTLAVAGR